MLPYIQSSYFRTLLSGIPNPVLIFNIEHVAYALNQRAALLLGRPAGECAGRTWSELFAGLADMPAFEAYMTGSLDQPEGRDPLAAVLDLPGAGRRHVSLATSLLIENEKVFGIFLAVTDVTRLVALHEREKRILEERSRLRRERAEGLRRLALAVAHQIRNPVMSMAGFANLLLRRSAPGSREAEMCGAIAEGGRRLEDIVAAVSGFTAISAGPRRRVDLGEALREAVGRAASRCPGEAVQVAWRVEAGGLAVVADPDLLRVALEELAANALEAAARAEGGRREAFLRAMADGEGGARIAVADSGPGVGEVDLPYLFDPFFTTKPVGVGMGLAKARRAALELGGDLAVAPAVGQGACFVLRLPPASLED